MTPRERFTAAGVRSARKLGYTPDWLRHRAAVYRHNARAYTSEEAREQALGLAYHYEQVADALETEKES